MKCEIEDFRVRNEEYATEMKTFAQSLEEKEGQIKEILRGLEGQERMEGESEFLKEAISYLFHLAKKKEMLDTLDQQVKIKAEEKKFQQMYNLHLDNSNMQYQYNQFDRRNIKNKRYGQNENVYKYFRELD